MTAAAPLVRTELANGRFTITLADEARRNALGGQLMSELVEACETAEADPEVRVIVLTNVGRTFCAGANLDEASRRHAGDPPGQPAPDPIALFGRFRRSSKPYVGRIAGHCVAGGMGLAAAVDIAIAADDALFGFTEVRIGVVPAVVSVVCLPKMRAVDAQATFLRGARFPAAEAARMGLIYAAVPADRLDAEVDAVVEDLILGGPGALAAAKKLLREVPGQDADDAFAWTRALSAELFASEEAAEGIRAFREKRRPAWAPDVTS